MDYQDFDAKINVKGLSIKFFFTGLMLSIEILIDELKPVVAEKNHFEERDISIMMAFFKISGPYGLRRKTQNHRFFKILPF